MSGTCELTNPVGVILRDIEDRRIKRVHLATTYAYLLQQSQRRDCKYPVPWRDINAAILKRWSPAGLTWIKERAWKISGVVLR